MKKYVFILMIIFVANACAKRQYGFRNTYKDLNEMAHLSAKDKEKPYLKAHFKNGNVFLFLDQWNIVNNKITGKATKFDAKRNNLGMDVVTIGTDSVAIFETNTYIESRKNQKIAALSLLTSFDIALTTLCLTNPKACFGSCPTFYMDDKEYQNHADAEGFSNAIAPSLAYADIDALNNKKISGGKFTITMKNEALETHIIRNLKLHAVRRDEGEEIYQSKDNKFYITDKNSIKPTAAYASEGNIKHLLESSDHLERFSYADEDNMSSKEEIFLDFSNLEMSDNYGIIINFRQSLMTTYLIYSAIAYMGNEVSDIFSKIEEKKSLRKDIDGFYKELGALEVYVLQDHKWVLVKDFYETGPIAFNKQIAPLKEINHSANLKLKLVLNKGLWRIDEVGLVKIKTEKQAVEIDTKSIEDLIDNNFLKISKDNPIVSMPGDEFKINFDLPDNDDYALFLESEGYYLEWMREDWLKEKNLFKLHQLINHPKRYLKKEASNYKKYEKFMEEQFWSSKIHSKAYFNKGNEQ